MFEKWAHHRSPEASLGGTNCTRVRETGHRSKHRWSQIGKLENFEKLENLGDYLFEKLKSIPSITIYGDDSSHIKSFNIENMDSYDLAMILNQYGICIRVGHLCAQPIMNQNNISSMSRISLYIYNDFNEIDFVISKIFEAINKLK